MRLKKDLKKNARYTANLKICSVVRSVGLDGIDLVLQICEVVFGTQGT